MVYGGRVKGGTLLERPLLKSILCQDDSYLLLYTSFMKCRAAGGTSIVVIGQQCPTLYARAIMECDRLMVAILLPVRIEYARAPSFEVL